MHLPTALQTPLTKALDCQVPILLAGMGGVARHELAAAVSHAGGFGVLGMVREPVARIRQEVLALREKTSHRFGVNLIPAATDAALLRAQVAECLALGVKTLVLFWDVDTDLVRHLKSEGIQVIYQIGSLSDADKALSAGADMLIAQGIEAGGHVRGTCATLSLVSQLSAFSPVPVIASGGIGSGRALAGALIQGAQGASIGSALLATYEANAHSHHKRRVIEADADDTVYTTLFSRNWHEAAPVRVLANAITRGEYPRSAHNRVLGRQDGGDIYAYSTDSPLADAEGDIDNMAIYCGQSCGQITTLVSAEQRIEQLVNEAAAALNLTEKT